MGRRVVPCRRVLDGGLRGAAGRARASRPRSVDGAVSSGFASQIDAPRPERGEQLFELYALPRPDSEDELVERLVEQWRLLCGSGVPFDADEWTRRVRAYVDRGQNPACPHVRLGPQVFGVDREAALRSLEVPTLVLHGSDDPMFPLPHGERLAATLPRVELEVFEGRGHDLHLHPTTPERIAAHAASAAARLG